MGRSLAQGAPEEAEVAASRHAPYSWSTRFDLPPDPRNSGTQKTCTPNSQMIFNAVGLLTCPDCSSKTLLEAGAPQDKISRKSPPSPLIRSHHAPKPSLHP